MAFIRKHTPSPVRAIRTPAIEGPIILAPFTMVEFRAIAFPRSSRFSTISTTNDCLAGTSKAFTHPRKIFRSTICHI